MKILNCHTGEIMNEGETIRSIVERTVKSRGSLCGADLSGADLSGANLSGADLSGAKGREAAR